MESTPSEQNPPPETATPPPAKRRHIPNVFGCVFAALVVLVLIGVALPNFNRKSYLDTHLRAYFAAKQIGLALRLYADDHDGSFPTAEGNPAGEPVAGSEARDANSAFRNLFPLYVTAEKLFYVPESAYCDRTKPDEIIDTAATCLKAGENGYAYVAGLKMEGDPMRPLVVEGTDGTSHYVADPKKRGGIIWQKNQRVIVIRADTSGATEKLAGPNNARFIPRSPDDPTHNLLDPAYLATQGAHLLEPAVTATAAKR